MTERFDDTPISEPTEDLFNIDPFAQSIANCIRTLGDGTPEGSVIAIYGAWGSGKSSAINLVCHHLGASDIHIIDFPVWKYKDEKAISAGFFALLSSEVAPVVSPGGKFASTLRKRKRVFLGTLSILEIIINFFMYAAWLGPLAKKARKKLKRFLKRRNTPEYLQDELAEILGVSGKRFLVIIDDLDRLLRKETLIVFKLLKSIGHLPNVMYLLAYDRKIVENSINRKSLSEGQRYIEKIVQAGFDLPVAGRIQLDSMLNDLLNRLADDIPEIDDASIGDLFHLFMSNEIRTPRDVLRLFNALSTTVAPVAKDVYFPDFISLEVLRLFQPNLYYAIHFYYSRSLHIAKDMHYLKQHKKSDDPAKIVLSELPEADQERLLPVLADLFPTDAMGWKISPERDHLRRVISPRHFDTYFRHSVSLRTIPQRELDFLLDPSANRADIRARFRDGLRVSAEDRSKASYMLEDLTSQSRSIDLATTEKILSDIYSFADELFIDGDGDWNSIENNISRLYQLTRTALLHETTLEERSGVLLRACMRATPEWLAYIAKAARDSSHSDPGQNLSSGGDALMTKEDAQSLGDLAVRSLKKVAKKGKILDTWHPLITLFTWLELQPKGSNQVQNYLAARLENDIFAAKLAKAFQEGGTYKIDVLKPLIDLKKFVSRLREVRSSQNLEGELEIAVLDFLNMWEELINKEKNRKR